MKTLLLLLAAGAALAGCAVYPAGYDGSYGYGYPAYGSVNVYGTYGDHDGYRTRDRDGRRHDRHDRREREGGYDHRYNR